MRLALEDIFPSTLKTGKYEEVELRKLPLIKLLTLPPNSW